jgi:hypothetical protein
VRRAALRLGWWLVFISMLLTAAGSAVATLFVNRATLGPIEVTGSATPDEFPSRTISNVMRGGDFVTRAPDGEAHVRVRFAAPVNIGIISHRYPWYVSPPYRIRRAVIQWSDDSSTWNDAAYAEDQGKPLRFNIGDIGPHRNWRLLALESGSAAEVVFGNLSFQPPGSPFDKAFEDLPVDVAWLMLIPALLAMFALSPLGLSTDKVFFSFAAPIAAFIIALSFGYAPIYPLIAGDSYYYAQAFLTGSFSEVRNSGYPTFIVAVGKLVGLGALPLIQLGIEVLCYVLGVRVLTVNSRFVWLAPLMLGVFCLQGIPTSFAPWILSEALFAAGLVLFGAGLAASARLPTVSTLVHAAIGLAIATAAKSVGIVLLIPALLLSRFLPTGTRLRAVAILVAPGLTIYAAMVGHAYHRTGTPAAETYAGISLIGHVGWMIKEPTPGEPSVTESVRKAVQPIIASRPAGLQRINSREKLENYIDYTSAEYNPLLWLSIIPAAQGSFQDMRALERYVLTLSIQSILSRPSEYALHVLAHFYGLWRDIGRSLEDLPSAAVNVRRYPGRVPEADRLAYDKNFGAALGLWPSQAELDSMGDAQLNVPLAFDELWTFVSHQAWLRNETIWLGLLAVLLSILFLVPGKVAWTYRAEIMLSLSINAYFLGHALFQVTLGRYAAAAIPAAILLALSFGGTTVHAVMGATLRKTRSLRDRVSARWPHRHNVGWRMPYQ